jgi:hypothetical protein
MMGDREQWVEKQLAREAKGRAKAEALATDKEMLRLVQTLTVKASDYCDAAVRWAAVGNVEEALAAGHHAQAALHLAAGASYAFEAGRPISLKARLDDVKRFLDNSRKAKRPDDAASPVSR